MTIIPDETQPAAANRPMTRDERIAWADKILDVAVAEYRAVKERTGSDEAGMVAAWVCLAYFDHGVSKLPGIQVRTAHRFLDMIEAGRWGEVARRLHDNVHARFPFRGPDAPTPQELMAA